MLGSAREPLEMNAGSAAWYRADGLEGSEGVGEWLEYGKPRHGAYMSTSVDGCIELVKRVFG